MTGGNRIHEEAVGLGDGRGLDRRRLLQGAVAAGVGVAAWSAPNITTLGFTPAYAAVCTVTPEVYDIGRNRNTSCNCNVVTPPADNPLGIGVGDKVVGYKPPTAAVCDKAFPGTAYIAANATCTVPNGQASLCPSGAGGGAGICIYPDDDDLFCRAQVLVKDGNDCGSGTVYATVLGPVGSDFLPLPQVPCASDAPWPSDIFLRIQVICSTNPECL